MRYCVDTEVHFTVLEITIEQLTSHIEQHAIVPSAFDFDDNAHWRSGPTVLTEGKSADQNVNELCGIASEARSNLNLPISNDAAFFEITRNNLDLRGFSLLWQSAAGTGSAVMLIVIVASLMSIRRVLVLEPAVVFRG